MFFSTAVLITNCLIFELIENSDPVLFSLALQLVSDNICSVSLLGCLVLNRIKTLPLLSHKNQACFSDFFVFSSDSLVG